MANSALVTYVDRGTGNYNSRTQPITKITIHIACSQGSCETLSDIIASCPSSSFNYGIATDGTVGSYVDERYRAWSTGDAENDNVSVSIMVCNSSLGPSYPISGASYNALIKLCVDICRRNFITELKYTGNKNTSNLTRHDWFASTTCPGPYLGSKFGEIANLVNQQLKQTATAISQTEALKAQSNIVVDSIDPYIVVADPKAKNINYKNLKIASVVGIMFYAGGYFESGFLHKKKDKYVSSTLKAQVADCDEADFPYALYCDVRARDAKEAREECEALFYVISKYPPKLGIWLGLDLIGSTKTTTPIIDTYYKYIYKWGLHDKCGFYCTKDQLSKIDWDKYCENFSLWIIQPISNVSNLYDLQTPNFFKL